MAYFVLVDCILLTVSGIKEFFSFQQVVTSDMGDSEDEYDRKRRDKFRGERTESYQRGEGRRGGGGEDRRREEWMER